MLVQRELGLRPSELLALETTDVSLPEHQHAPRTLRAVVALGVSVGTKSKRAQAALLKDALLINLLRYVISMTKPGDRIFPFSYTTYRRLLINVEQKLSVSIGWTPHSPRAGFASVSIQDGASFWETREAGRWLADSSLRVYIDLVAVGQISSSQGCCR